MEQSFIELARRRRSCRGYSERPVDDADIACCLEAARLAPSACNGQPWRFVVVKSAERRGRICRDGLLPGIPMPWLAAAPVIVVVAAELSMLTHKIAPAISGVNYHLLDIGIAGEHFVLAAAELGLGTCWIGWFRERRVRKIIEAPRSWRIVSLISLGHPAATAAEGGAEKLELAKIARIDTATTEWR